MQLHTLTKSSTTKAKPRLGRGGKRGKTCGHGHKGQKQHGRHGIRPQMRDFIKKLPKLRGYGKNRARTVNSGKTPVYEVALSSLEKFKGDVTPQTLADAGIVERLGGKLPRVKILANVADFKSKLVVSDCAVSQSARELIEKAGGEIK